MVGVDPSASVAGNGNGNGSASDRRALDPFSFPSGGLQESPFEFGMSHLMSLFCIFIQCFHVYIEHAAVSTFMRVKKCHWCTAVNPASRNIKSLYLSSVRISSFPLPMVTWCTRDIHVFHCTPRKRHTDGDRAVDSPATGSYTRGGQRYQSTVANAAFFSFPSGS